MLRRAERYIRVAFRYTRFVMRDQDGRVVLSCDHPDPSPFGRREQEVAFFLGQWLTWGRTLVGDAVGAEAVRMRWRGPSDATPWRAFFGCPVGFGAGDDALTFRRGVLDLSLPEHTPELAEMFGSYAAALVRRLQPETSFVDRVREALVEGLLSDAANEAAVAARLGITVRTLHRRLAEAESSFRQLRNGLLRSRAEQMLREQQLPIAEVAYLLGYSEPSTFHRAFRRWTGVAPAEWRRRAATSAIA
jgi:AraC-like DNA-binding protein